MLNDIYSYKIIYKDFKKGLLQIGSNEIILDVVYNSIDLSYIHHHLVLLQKGSKFGLYNVLTKKHSDVKFDNILENSLGFKYIKVIQNNKYGLLSKDDFNTILPFKYSYIFLSLLPEGYITVEMNNKVGLLDLNCKELFPCRFNKDLDLVKLYQKKLKLKEELLK